MDNVIQNININDIIPMNNNETFNPNELTELVNSIKKFGIIEPLIVRPINGKYEIVLGNKMYQAAQLAGINLLPAIVKDIDNNIINEYRAISNMAQDTKETISNNIPQNTLQSNQEIDSDIVNLQELNKQEYEREDVIMNNEQNNMMNNNLGAAQTQEPTFGGKFFPSLEDEPTNMNMGNMMNNPAPTPEQNNSVQPNFIDLTDSTATPQPQSIPEINSAPMPEQPVSEPMNINNNFNNTPPMANSMDINTPTDSGNTINLENLTSGYNQVEPEQPLNQPVNESSQAPMPGPMDMNIPNSNEVLPDSGQIQQPMMNEQASMLNIPNEQPTNIPQFDMSQSIAPNPIMSPDIGLNVNANAVDPMPEQPISEPMNINNDLNNSAPMPGPIDMNIQNSNAPIPNMNNQEQTSFEPQPNINIEQSLNEQINNENPALPPKDITPAISMIKALASNVELFGYNINITDEDLPTSVKITIEIKK